MTEIENEIALVIPSCDAYADAWNPLIQGLQHFWSDKGFPTYLITNYLRPTFHDVKVIAVGQDVSWSDNLIVALKNISEPYILLNIDDLILYHPINHSEVMKIISPFIIEKGDYLRLNPTPPGQGGKVTSKIPTGAPYRTSTQFSLWRKDVLQTLLRSGETAWDFEIKGSVRSDNFSLWYASKVYLIRHVNLIIKGKVDPSAANTLRNVGIAVNNSRPVLSWIERLSLRLRILRSKIFFLLFPPKIARSIRNLFASA